MNMVQTQVGFGVVGDSGGGVRWVGRWGIWAGNGVMDNVIDNGGG